MIAANHDKTNAILVTLNMSKVYSPVDDLAVPMGRKPAAVTSVPESIGHAVLAYANVAADNFSKPSSSFLTIISTTIMASSTSNPNAMISAPVEMRCRSILKICIAKNVAISTNGIVSATTAPARHPSDKKLTASTMATASSSERMKVPTASFTTFG